MLTIYLVEAWLFMTALFNAFCAPITAHLLYCAYLAISNEVIVLGIGEGKIAIPFVANVDVFKHSNFTFELKT
jgi:hypothetical protein